MWRYLRPSNSSITSVFWILLALGGVVAFVTPPKGLGSPQTIPPASHSMGNATQTPTSASQGTGSELATRIMHVALHQAVWGPPAWCQVRQQMEQHGTRASSFGKMIRAGKGSGKVNLSMQLTSGDAIDTVVQISDGQRLQTIEEFDGKRRRSVVDLDEIHSQVWSLVPDKEAMTRDPVIAMYLAIGGQAESLRKLCQQYKWHSVREGNFGEHPVWILEGVLASEPPAVRALAPCDQQLFLPKSSGLLPTQVQVAVGKPDSPNGLSYWLFQVEHRREEPSEGMLQLPTSMKLITEWAKPKRIDDQELTPDHFQVISTSDPMIDETELYLPPTP